MKDNANIEQKQEKKIFFLEIVDKKLVVILGPTASGKTKLAVMLANQIVGEVISADSRQVYRGMDIGTGKDLSEYGTVPHHLIDIVEAGDDYNVAFFQRDFQKVYEKILLREKTPILCGGTGMYIEAVLKNHQHTQIPIDEVFREYLKSFSEEELREKYLENVNKNYPEANVSTHKRLIRAIEISEFLSKNPSNLQSKPLENYIVFGIDLPAEIRRARITKRLHRRLSEGMIEEVENLLEKGISAEKLIFYGLEYKFITEYLLQKMTYEEMVSKLEIAIHQFSKRQMTFFRSMERKGVQIHWLDGRLSPEILLQKMNSFGLKSN